MDSEWLDTLFTRNEGERLLKRLGASSTPYGVISARGHSLYVPVSCHEPEVKELKTQALTDEKLDVIEVLGRKALFSNGRILPEEIPEGLYAYDLRYSDEKGQFISIEPKVGVNHGGTVLMRELLDFREKGYLSFILEHDNPIKDGETIDGIANGQMNQEIQWKCQYEDALIQPPRDVLDINMGEYASGTR